MQNQILSKFLRPVFFAGASLISANIAFAQAAFSFGDKLVPKIMCVGQMGTHKIQTIITLREADETGESSVSKMELLKDDGQVLKFAPKDLRTGLVAIAISAEASSGMESVVVATFYQGSGLKGLVYLRGPSVPTDPSTYLLTMSVPSAELAAAELPMSCTTTEALP